MTAPRVVLTDHAQLKLRVLAQHGFSVTAAAVMQVVAEPDRVEEGTEGGR